MILSLLFLASIPEDAGRADMERLFYAYYPLMRATAWAIARQRHDTDEIISESLMALYENRDRLRQLSNDALPSYIISTVRNTAFNFFKRNKRMHMQFLHVSDDVINQVPDEENTEQKLLLLEELRRVREAIYALPERERLAMRLKFDLDKSDTEIAEAMGISPESVRRSINRARARIRQIVYGEEAER